MTPTAQRGVIERAKEIQTKQAQTIDGHPRSAEMDEAINEAVAHVLATGDGASMFDWLRQITTNKVLGANASDAELRYQEGMRMIVALIEARRLAHDSRLIKKQKKAK